MRLIVGIVDGPSGDDALALGERCARSAGFELHLCAVISPTPLLTQCDGMERAYAARDEAALAVLNAARARLTDDIVSDIHVVQDESPAKGLLSMAHHLDASAIVVGGSFARGGPRLAAGGAAFALLHASSYPVILASRAGAHRGVERLGSITCALGPRTDHDLVRIAALCAQVADTPLRVMSLLAPSADAEAGSRPRTEHRDAMHLRLTMATDLAQECLPVDFPVSSVLAEGDSIEDAAARLEWGPGDVLVLGSSRLARPGRAFVGSSAEKMLRVLNVPAVLVPNNPYALTTPERARERVASVRVEQPSPTSPR